MRTLAVLAALMLVAACQPAPQATPPASQATNPFPPDTSAILLGDAALGLTRQCSRISPGPVAYVWTPEAETIASLEALLGPLIGAELGNKWPNDPLTATEYFRQYAGLVINGRRIVYVNGVHRQAVVNGGGDDWKRRPIGICDGGPITFGVEYDPATKTFANFAFNGAL